MNKINVLLPEGGGIGAIGLINCLQKANYRVISADIDSQLAGLYHADKGYILPKKWDEYDRRLKEIIEKENIDIVIPVHDISVSHFCTLKLDVPVIHDIKMATLARNKYDTAMWLKHNGFNYPLVYVLDKVDKFPVLIKPISGWATQGVYKANNELELQIYFDLCKKSGWIPIIQEYLEGIEYTNMAYISKDKEVLSTVVSSVIKKNGISQKITIHKEGLMNEELVRIAKKLDVVGAVSMQGIETNKGFTVFEFNARFSMTEILRTIAGVNGPDLLIQNWLYGIKTYPRIEKTIKAFTYNDYVCMSEEHWRTFDILDETSNTCVKRKVI